MGISTHVGPTQYARGPYRRLNIDRVVLNLSIHNVKFPPLLERMEKEMIEVTRPVEPMSRPQLRIRWCLH